MGKTVKRFISFAIFLVYIQFALGDWTSSVAELNNLITKEPALITSLQRFISLKKTQLRELERLTNQLDKITKNVSSNEKEYIAHPINQYHLIKRFATQWTALNRLLHVFNATAYKFHTYMSKMAEYFPNTEDVNATYAGIARLQKTYDLNITEIIIGNIKGRKSQFKLSAMDCFSIGIEACKSFDCHACNTWMNKAHKYTKKENFTFEVGKFSQVVEITIKLLKQKPHNLKLLQNLAHYRKRMDQQKLNKHIQNSQQPRNQYHQLCRGNIHTPINNTKRALRCYLYTNNGDPQLVIKPEKVEELSHSPQIIRIYNVIGDKDINQIKAESKPRLTRSQVYNETNGSIVNNQRTSKVTWLKQGDLSAVNNLYRRIGEITGLCMDTAEELQVANYGFAGEYQPHFDFSEHNTTEKYTIDGNFIRNRIATVLVYLSEVYEGGGTAFVKAGVIAQPIKGSAVFWYNIYPSGDVDKRTLHGACPVLLGNKWASNVWIHEKGQEFRRKCSTNQNADNIIL